MSRDIPHIVSGKIVIQTQVSLIPECELVSTHKVPNYCAMIWKSMNSANFQKSNRSHILFHERNSQVYSTFWGEVVCFLVFLGCCCGGRLLR